MFSFVVNKQKNLLDLWGKVNTRLICLLLKTSSVISKMSPFSATPPPGKAHSPEGFDLHWLFSSCPGCMSSQATCSRRSPATGPSSLSVGEERLHAHCSTSGCQLSRWEAARCFCHLRDAGQQDLSLTSRQESVCYLTAVYTPPLSAEGQSDSFRKHRCRISKRSRQVQFTCACQGSRVW